MAFCADEQIAAGKALIALIMLLWVFGPSRNLRGFSR